jgi:hypothetical protein
MRDKMSQVGLDRLSGPLWKLKWKTLIRKHLMLSPREASNLAGGLPWIGAPREIAMLQSIQKLSSVSALPIEWIAGTAVLATSAWLLATDRIPPAVVYLVQLFLTF